MIVVFTVLFFLAIVSLIVGLIKPSLIIRWGANEKKTRGRAALISIIAIVIFAIGAMSSTNSPSKVSSPEITTKTTQETQKTLQWNKSDPDPLKNGNMKIAAEELKKYDTLANIAERQDVSMVYKSPWDYYGKVIAFAGTVAVAENNPPDSNVSKALGGESCEVVIQYGEDIIVDGIIAGNANSIKVGQQVTIYGYPVGRTEVKNKMGGSFTHLVVVGKLQ